MRCHISTLVAEAGIFSITTANSCLVLNINSCEKPASLMSLYSHHRLRVVIESSYRPYSWSKQPLSHAAVRQRCLGTQTDWSDSIVARTYNQTGAT